MKINLNYVFKRILWIPWFFVSIVLPKTHCFYFNDKTGSCQGQDAGILVKSRNLLFLPNLRSKQMVSSHF